MISEKVLHSLEFDKIEKICSEYAVLERSKRMLCEEVPADDAAQAEFLLKKTAEAFKLLYDYGVAGVDFFDELTDEPARAKRNSTLSMGDLLRVARMLRSSRYVYNSVTAITDEEITALRALAESLYCDKYLEDEIFGKILSDDRMSDNASEALAFIRRKIKRAGERTACVLRQKSGKIFAGFHRDDARESIRYPREVGIPRASQGIYSRPVRERFYVVRRADGSSGTQ